MARIGSNFLGSAADLLARLTGARAGNLDGLTPARTALMDNLARLNAGVPGSQHQSIPTTTAVTPGNFVKSAWREIVASTNFDTCLIVFYLYGDVQAQTGVFLLDIGTGAAGSESVLIENIRFGNTGFTGQKTLYFHLPVRVASGTRLAYRAQAQYNAAQAGHTLEIGGDIFG